MEFRQLEYFMEVAKREHMTDAQKNCTSHNPLSVALFIIWKKSLVLNYSYAREEMSA